MTKVTSLWLSLLVCFFAPPVTADNYPSRPIRAIVPYPAGGGLDVVARLINERLSKVLGQPVLTDNRPGASGTLGANAVAKAAPDGYTLLYGTLNEQVIYPALNPNLLYDPVKAFAPVIETSKVSMLLVARPPWA